MDVFDPALPTSSTTLISALTPASWTSMGYDATPKGRVGYACTVFGSKIFVTGGYDSLTPSYKHADLWATSDFATWTEQNASFFW